MVAPKICFYIDKSLDTPNLVISHDGMIVEARELGSEVDFSSPEDLQAIGQEVANFLSEEKVL